jgi:hypothetical protein
MCLIVTKSVAYETIPLLKSAIESEADISDATFAGAYAGLS